MNEMTDQTVQSYKEVAFSALREGDLNDAPERILSSVLKVFVRDPDSFKYSEIGSIVRALDEIGFFRFRNAVYDLADTLGVSRVTIYKYLNKR